MKVADKGLRGNPDLTTSLLGAKTAANIEGTVFVGDGTKAGQRLLKLKATDPRKFQEVVLKVNSPEAKRLRWMRGLLRK